MITCTPIFKFDSIQFTQVKYNIQIINQICIFGLFISIIPFFEQLYHLRDILASANLSDTFSEIHDDNTKVLNLSIVGITLLRIVKVLYNLMFICAIPLIKEKKTSIIVLLGIFMIIITANMSPIIMASRGLLVQTVLKVILVVAMFYPMLSKDERRRILKFCFIILLIILVFFFIITISRSNTYLLKGRRHFSLLYFMCQYMGEGTLFFNQYLGHINNHTNGEYCFYYVRLALGFDSVRYTRDVLYSMANYVGIPLMVFYTFLGFFVIDIGYFWTFVYWAILALSVRTFIKAPNSKMRLSTLFLFFIYATTILDGTCVYEFTSANAFSLFHYAFVYAFLRLCKM